METITLIGLVLGVALFFAILENRLKQAWKESLSPLVSAIEELSRNQARLRDLLTERR